MHILGVETSCDETSVAVIDDNNRILSNIIHTQEVHSRFGGVVPEVASRAHVKKIVPTYQAALAEAEMTLDDIGLIAATMGPGLVGPLLVGLTFAKGLAFARDIPFVAVNHMEGHLAANILEHPDLSEHHLTLIVSGGHTMLVEVEKFGHYRMIGRTKDDAAGEAFDKVAKLLGLGYPGGAELDRKAESGDPNYCKFPRPLIKEPGFQFSFSGLKTAVAIHVGKLDEQSRSQHIADIAASFQEAAVDVLSEKTIKAAQDKQITDITLSGGVAANRRLRSVLGERCDRAGLRLFYPSPALCTDNAAMIAAAGYYRFREDGPSELITNAVPYLKLEQA